ncbi:TPA: hypothetical protein IXQ08_000166 [Enterococcus faecium]|nr:hypothetical protein [Enterococcus faecium]
MNSMANAYAKAGVDVEAGYEVVERIKKHVKKNGTFRYDGRYRRIRRLF